MNRYLYAIAFSVAVSAWWVISTPPAYHPVPANIVFDDEAVAAVKVVDRSVEFAEKLQRIESDLPGYDDVLFLSDGKELLLSAMDGKLWRYDLVNHTAEEFLDVPLMAAGLHESHHNEDEVYFCASYLWGETYPANERVGLYRLNLVTQQLDALVLQVPDTEIADKKVWPITDAKAPGLIVDSNSGAAVATRPLAFCNDLEISEDGQRIYFSEPFAYQGASMGGGTVAEAISFNGNGRIWMHNLETSETRLVAEGFFFPDGILYDLHPGEAREESIISSLTPGFAIIRIYVDGPKAGTSEVVHSGLGGMCDGLDRDARGNIWCAMFAQRSEAITWLHENAWLKHLLLRLPLNWLPQPKTAGVLALTPDASGMLYSAWYRGERAAHIASVLPGPDGYLYVSPFDRAHRGLVRFINPLSGDNAVK